MSDYCSLIADAVVGLSQNTAKARRAVYERARVAQVAQLRALDPPLSESVIVKERWALENAIRKVETDIGVQSSRLTAPRPATIRLRRQVALGRPKPLLRVPTAAEIQEHRLPSAATLGEVEKARVQAAERSDKNEKLPSGSGALTDSGASDIQRELLVSNSVLADDQHSVSELEGNEGHRLTQPASHRILAKLLLALSLLQAAGAALFWQWPSVRDAYQQISLVFLN
jgi:hypothetical protein